MIAAVLEMNGGLLYWCITISSCIRASLEELPMIVITNEILALLICWAVGTIMNEWTKDKAEEKKEIPAVVKKSLLKQFALTEREKQARLDALRIVAQERLKEQLNGK